MLIHKSKALLYVINVHNILNECSTLDPSQ